MEVAFWSFREPLRKFYCKAVECRLPVPNRHGPFLRDVAHRQVDHLVDRLIGGENTVVGGDLAQCHIQRLDSVGGIDHAANVSGKGKQRDHSRQLGPPGLADAGIEAIPFLSKQLQVEFGFLLCCRRVNGL